MDNTKSPFQRAIQFQQELVDFFAGGKHLNNAHYSTMRDEILTNPVYGGLAPDWLRPNRDIDALWSFAKSINPSWEPRRQFVRKEFEPLLSYLESGDDQRLSHLIGSYDATAWTGVKSVAQQALAIRTLIPVAQAAIGSLIQHLEQPNHNGAPPLEETSAALAKLRTLHEALGRLLEAVDAGQLRESIESGLISEIARYGRQTARALKYDPLPYALSATLLAVFTACGFPNLGGYLGGVAMAINKPKSQSPAE